MNITLIMPFNVSIIKGAIKFLLFIFGINLLFSSELLAIEASAAKFEFYKPKKSFFWDNKRKLKKIVKDRKVFVSVTSDTVKENNIKTEKLFLSGVTVIDLPFDFVRRKITSYQELIKVSPKNFKEIKYNPRKNELYVHGVALKWHAKMLLILNEELDLSKDTKSFNLHFFIKSGSFKGLKGYFQIKELAEINKPLKEVGHIEEDSKRRDKLFSMVAFYQAEKMPLPSFLLNFGLEVVLKSIAAKMRDFLLEEYTASGASNFEETVIDGK